MNAEWVCLSIQRSIEVERERGRTGRGRRKPSIVVDCARQLEPNNRPPFLAERLYCERQLTAEYAHVSAMPRRSARSTHNERYARRENNTDTLLPHVSLSHSAARSWQLPIAGFPSRKGWRSVSFGYLGIIAHEMIEKRRPRGREISKQDTLGEA